MENLTTQKPSKVKKVKKYKVYNCTEILSSSTYLKKCFIQPKPSNQVLLPSYVCCKNITIVAHNFDNDLNKNKWNCSSALCNDSKQYQGTGHNMIKPLLISMAALLFWVLLAIFVILLIIWILKKKPNHNVVNDDPPGSLTNEPLTLNYVMPDVANTRKESAQMRLANHIQQLVKELNNQDTSKISPKLPIKEQANVIPYDPKLELDRQHFTLGEMLGSGNSGTVYKGQIVGLFYPNSKTTVAIKTINDTSSWDDVTSLLCEIKILSNLNLHCNLVNMLGACTSNAEVDGNIFVLLEFCEMGNLKDYLIKNRDHFIDSFAESKPPKAVNSRLFIQWAYDIAMGMSYLAEKKIMHGDLAARNVLLGGGDHTKGGNLTAKIADFGLSKQMYESKYYKKTERSFVPWKWMAFEYLQNGKFEMKSDVWSYGVVIWEIFSLGKEPYNTLSYNHVFEMLKRGEYLGCPDGVEKISNWPATEMYEELAHKCFNLQVNERSSFADLVVVIKSELSIDELKCYNDVTNEYSRRSALLLDDNTRRRLKSAVGRRGSSWKT